MMESNHFECCLHCANWQVEWDDTEVPFEEVLRILDEHDEECPGGHTSQESRVIWGYPKDWYPGGGRYYTQGSFYSGGVQD